jgi:hypothetical protein
LDGRESLYQLSLHGDDEVQTPEAHVHTQGLVDVVAGHPKPDESDKTHAKGPYLARQLSVLQNHRLVNFVDCVSRLGWCAKRTRGCILVRTECPNV